MITAGNTAYGNDVTGTGEESGEGYGYGLGAGLDRKSVV